MKSLEQQIVATFIGTAFVILAPFASAAEGDAAATAPVASDLVVNQADTLGEVLDNVEQRRVVESREHTQRETRFRNDKTQQAGLLADAQADYRVAILDFLLSAGALRIGDDGGWVTYTVSPAAPD